MNAGKFSYFYHSCAHKRNLLKTIKKTTFSSHQINISNLPGCQSIWYTQLGPIDLCLFIKIYLYRVYTFSKTLFYNMALLQLKCLSC